jgi:hypothetical protein
MRGFITSSIAAIVLLLAPSVGASPGVGATAAPFAGSGDIQLAAEPRSQLMCKAACNSTRQACEIACSAGSDEEQCRTSCSQSFEACVVACH